MNEDQTNALLTMTAEIVANYVANNATQSADVPNLIGAIHAALAALGTVPEPAATAETSKGAVGIRKSLANPDSILSMIDGKPYQTLARHIKRHGYTASSYRATFGLPIDYPLTAPGFSEKRSQLAKSLGLGRKPNNPPPPAPLPKRRTLKVKTG